MLFAGDAWARKYKVGDSVEITDDAILELYAQPGNRSQPAAKVLELGDGNTFDVEVVKTLDGNRWLKIRVFLKIVTEQSERYRTIGRGWVTREQIDGRAQRESKSWSSGVAAYAPSKLPKPKPKPKPKTKARPATQPNPAAKGTPAEGSAPEEVKEAPGGGPGLTQKQTTELAAQFRQLHGGLKSANAILQGGMVTMVIQATGDVAFEDAQGLGASFVGLFRPYNYKYLVYVTDEKGKAVVSGKQDIGATSIAWAEPKKTE